MPIQPSGARGIKGNVEVFTEYCAGLKDLDGFSHIILIYHFHLAGDYNLEARPFLEEKTHGVFAIRAPKRPNPIGMSIVRLTGLERCVLYVEDVDIVDNTPLLDIKPYVPDFDQPEAERIGWLSDRSKDVTDHRADSRFMQ